jgi:ArsR family transcriptional regulator
MENQTAVTDCCEGTTCCEATVVVALPEDRSAERLAQLAWALAHPMRVRIVRMLIERTSCVCGEIVDALPIAQSTVSQHLKILKESGLVQGEVEGPKVCYCINPKALEDLKSLVAGI